MSFFSGYARVGDGDSIVVEGERVRIAGIDAPEMDQTAYDAAGRRIRIGELAKRYLDDWIGGRLVSVHTHTIGKYGRTVAEVRDDRGNDVGATLVAEGLAVSAYGAQYKALEREAKRERRGMWALQDWQYPQAHRKAKRGPARMDDESALPAWAIAAGVAVALLAIIALFPYALVLLFAVGMAFGKRRRRRWR